MERGTMPNQRKPLKVEYKESVGILDQAFDEAMKELKTRLRAKNAHVRYVSIFGCGNSLKKADTIGRKALYIYIYIYKWDDPV
jgi:hypothetical protein